jgi:TrmH RNA methyltransferase
MKHRPRKAKSGPSRAPFAPEPPPRAAVEATHGLRAGLAVFDRRRDDIVRVAYSRAVGQEVAELVRWCTSRRLPCAEVSDAELERVAESSHNEGLCVVARPRKWLSTKELWDGLSSGQGVAIALDRVRNPYNVGAILRSAAFLGFDAALLGAPAPHPGLSPAAIRVAEGGAEHLRLARTTDLGDTLGRLRAGGAHVVGADGLAKTSAVGFAFGRPAVLVLGHEREGLGDRVRAQCDAVVSVPGAGRIESLNVAVAAGILMAEMKRGSWGIR